MHIQQHIELQRIYQYIDQLDIQIHIDKLLLRMGLLEYIVHFDIDNLMDSEHLHMDQLERIVYFDMYNHKYILDSNKYYHRIDNHLVVVEVVDE